MFLIQLLVVELYYTTFKLLVGSIYLPNLSMVVSAMKSPFPSYPPNKITST